MFNIFFNNISIVKFRFYKTYSNIYNINDFIGLHSHNEENNSKVRKNKTYLNMHMIILRKATYIFFYIPFDIHQVIEASWIFSVG